MNQRKLNRLDKDKLKPCPFCGEKPIYYTTNEHHYIGGWMADVVLECCVTMKEGFGTQSDSDTQNDAKETLIKRWNDRL